MMAGLYGHNKMQETISKYLKELDNGLIQTSPRLTARKPRKYHFRADSYSKNSVSSKTPEPIRGRTISDIARALEIIKKKEDTVLDKKILKLPNFKPYMNDDPVIKLFVEAIFSSEPSVYKKSSVNSDVDNVDVVSADKILVEARKIIKSGVRKKKSANQTQDDIEYFWSHYISKDKVIRWDIFEENFITFVSSYMVTDLGIVRKVNWRKVLQKLFNKYSVDSQLSAHWLSSPSTEGPPELTQKTISLKDLSKAVSSQDLFKIVSSSVDEICPEKIKHKSDVEFFYTCGCVYKGQWKEGRRDGSGLLKLCSQETYEGYFTRGLFHSFGVLSYYSYSFKGFFRKDYFHGFGKLLYPNGSSFEGVFNKDRFVKGTLRFQDGKKYFGEFLNQNFEGKGELVTTWNEVHKGMWAEGKLNGDSKILYNDGSRVSGVFINGKISNFGKLKNDSFVYKGEFLGIVPNGSGKFEYKSGIVYEGQVKMGKLHGTGLLVYPNGDRYEGEFKDSSMNGTGKIKFKDGKEYEGEVVDDKPQGFGKMVFLKGNLKKFEGNFENGVIDGEGEAWFEDGCYYKGTWKDGKIEGKGKLITKVFEYEGEISLARFQGYGSVKIAGGFYFGLWEKGVCEGKGEVKDWLNNYYSGIFKDGRPLVKSKIDQSFLDKLMSIDLSPWII